jgi:hypothetical protein
MYSGTSETTDNARPPRVYRIKIVWFLAAWFVLSVIWGGGVAYNLYQQISMQADMSRDVERDLEQGFVNASCTGADCGSGGAVERTQNWSGIASTYLKFGRADMMECAFGPPAILLVVGLGSLLALRRRRVN